MPLNVLTLARLPEGLGSLIAAVRGWTPIGKNVELRVEVSTDPYMVGRELAGTVRAWDDESGSLLIEVGGLLGNRDRGRFSSIIAACPLLRWHRPPRLLVMWTAVRYVLCSSLPVDEHAETIGSGRLLLHRRRKDV